MEASDCPFEIGDLVRFTPSTRTRGLYQDVEGFGVRIGEVLPIRRIKDDTYLYFDQNKGEWPWTEFTLVSDPDLPRKS